MSLAIATAEERDSHLEFKLDKQVPKHPEQPGDTHAWRSLKRKLYWADPGKKFS